MSKHYLSNPRSPMVPLPCRHGTEVSVGFDANETYLFTLERADVSDGWREVQLVQEGTDDSARVAIWAEYRNGEPIEFRMVSSDAGVANCYIAWTLPE